VRPIFTIDGGAEVNESHTCRWPKYSPDLNTIEQVFAKLKHLLRKAAARTPDAVCAAIGQLLDNFTPPECVNYFMNSGYERA
jgi:transposase